MASITRTPVPDPILADYALAQGKFTWNAAQELLDGLPHRRGLNIAYEAIDRHVDAGRGDHVAIRWMPRSGEAHDLTYGDLQHETNHFASALHHLTGETKGTRVASLLGRIPALYVSVLGTLKARGVYTPLFSAFGPEPIKQRVNLGEIEVLVTTSALYRRKVAPIRSEMPTLRHIILIDRGVDDAFEHHVVGYDDFLSCGTDRYVIEPTNPDELALLHFTSGTTGTPKGAMHVHSAVVAHHVTGQIALDLHADDVFWCTADPGWVTGTSYGIISPLTNGVTSIVYEGEFDADTWYDIVESQRVTVWYTAPTALRMMMRIGPDAVTDHDLSSLRIIASVGEPLNPEVVEWASDAFGVPILDNWWQTETGGIMIANYRSQPVKPGSMGRPMPGIDVALLERDDSGELAVNDTGTPTEIDEPDKVGEIAIRSGWPSMFRGYLGMTERYEKCFAKGWYRSGDLAKRDGDGYYWFVGRSDDVIKTAGHLVGPFEVESILLEHPDVTEAGVIGIPDPTAGEIIKAFVSLRAGVDDSAELRRDIIAHARRQLGSAVAPRAIEVQPHIPKTRSGKIMRRLLKARELGLPEGDLSTLEEPHGNGPTDTSSGSSTGSTGSTNTAS